MAIGKVRYFKRGKDTGGYLKYLEYREGSLRAPAFARATPEQRAARRGWDPDLRDGHLPAGRRGQRWVDRGLGDSHRAIRTRAAQWAGRRVAAWEFTVSPDPALMAHLPAEDHARVVGGIAERAVEGWYADNGWGVPEYAYVVHQATVSPDDPHGAGRARPHAHVIAPGTRPVEPGLGRADLFIHRRQMRGLRERAEEALVSALEQELGPARTQAILRERRERLLEARYPGLAERRAAFAKRHRLGTAREVVDAFSLLDALGAADAVRRRGGTSRAPVRAVSRFRRYRQAEQRRARELERVARREGWERREVEAAVALAAERVRQEDRVIRLARKRVAELAPTQRSRPHSPEHDL